MIRRFSLGMLKALCLQELAAIVPQLNTLRPTVAADALAAVMALSRCRLIVRQRTNDVAPLLSVDPAPRADRVASSLLTIVSSVIEAPLRPHDRNPTDYIGTWLDSIGSVDLIASLLTAGADLDALRDLAKTVSSAITRLCDRVEDLRSTHFKAIIARDIPYWPGPRAGLSQQGHWLLAPDRSGDPQRPIIMERRRQAMEIYGAVTGLLFEGPLTEAIDEGRPLKPLLCRRLDLTAAHLRRIRGARDLEVTLSDHGDYTLPVRELVAHSVPLAEWPEVDGWLKSPWMKVRSPMLFRIDYVGSEPEPRDALKAFVDDILGSVIAARAQVLGHDSRSAFRSLQTGYWPASQLPERDRRVFLTELHKAVIGPRSVKSFHEAVARWHRRAASIAAMRHERTVDKPGWPALCPNWHSSDGVYKLVPLTSAAELVGEGNALQHCVGGYYSHCRSGHTQILSMRSGDDHKATLELLLSGEPGTVLSIRSGQFRSFRDYRPPEHLYDVVREFLDDLKSGRHPIHQSTITAYRKKMARSGDYAWHGSPLPMEHARSVWPLYRTLVPRGASDDFDSWCDASGLNSACDHLLNAMAAPKHEPADDYIPL